MTSAPLPSASHVVPSWSAHHAAVLHGLLESNEGVALSLLSQIAQARGRLDEAEGYYRQGLAILQDVQNAANYGSAALALGALLIQRRGELDEGCILMHEAIRIRHDLGLPGEDAPRARAEMLGCDA